MQSIAAYIDEISMVPADQFLQCDVRMRQAKMRPEIRFGGMAVNLCGDFLQLPPVNKDGSKPSLAKRPSKVAEVESVDEETAAIVDESERAEFRQGFELWRSIMGLLIPSFPPCGCLLPSSPADPRMSLRLYILILMGLLHPLGFKETMCGTTVTGRAMMDQFPFVLERDGLL